jgi:hypothetical protein
MCASHFDRECASHFDREMRRSCTEKYFLKNSLLKAPQEVPLVYPVNFGLGALMKIKSCAIL